nr:MAG TPA: hypothetical protein [Caudoviricetes sp.]
MQTGSFITSSSPYLVHLTPLYFRTPLKSIHA